MGENFRLAKEIAHIAARQQRIVTRAQLQVIGLDDAAIHRRVRAGLLYRVHRGVYSVGAPPVTPLEHAMAAVLACGEGAVLSNGSALTLWGIWKRWDRPFDVIVKTDRRPKGVNVHRTKLDPSDITRHMGIPATTLERTLLDMAEQMPRKSLNRAVNNGRLSGHLRVPALAAVIKRNPYHPGKAALRYCVGLASSRPTRSGVEDDFPAFCERYGLPKPEMGAIVCGHEVDALFRNEKLIVELDSWEFHSSRTSYESDRDRDADTLAGGFATVRIPWDREDFDPEREAKRLRTILARRRRRAA